MDSSLGDFLDCVDAIETVELVANPRCLARPRLYRERSDFFTKYDDKDFFIRYRLSKESVLFLLRKVERFLEYPDNRNKSIAPIKQLLCALRFYATGSHLQTIADIGGISVASCCRIVKRVSVCISKLRKEFITFPENEMQQQSIKADFHSLARFPNVIGCIDCTHIKIQSLGGDDAELFRNRKGYMSINMQTISSPKLLIMDVVARWPGSTHDSTIYQSSRRFARFDRGDYPGCYLLGDSGYPLKGHLLTPYLNPSTLGQQRYNEAHIKTRNVVERQYGVLKRRFPILALGLRLKLQNAMNVIVACCVLHNICIIKNDPEPINDGSIYNLEELISEGHIPEIQRHINEPYYGFQRNQVTSYFENMN